MISIQSFEFLGLTSSYSVDILLFKMENLQEGLHGLQGILSNFNS